MKTSPILLCFAIGGCVTHQHLGVLGDAPDASAGSTAAEAGNQDVAISDASGDIGAPDRASPDVDRPDVKLDVAFDGPSSGTASASCMTSCTCQAADTCLLECSGAPGCAATCGVSRSCSVHLLGENNTGDCRSTATCDVSCRASCAVECGSSPCKIACAAGQACAVQCGGSAPQLCPDGLTVVCNGHDC